MKHPLQHPKTFQELLLPHVEVHLKVHLVPGAAAAEEVVARAVRPHQLWRVAQEGREHGGREEGRQAPGARLHRTHDSQVGCRPTIYGKLCKSLW